VKHQVIRRNGKPAFVVIPIEEWRQIEATIEDRIDIAAARASLSGDDETFPDSVVASIIEGVHPIKAFREYREMTQAQLAAKVGTSAMYVSQLERGGRRAGRKLRAKIGSALRVNADLLEARESN
jgi:DNA-binding XRE family transcriptional regulator